jgi:hypothetical protein
VRSEARPAVVAEREATGDGALHRPKRSWHASRSRSAAAKRSIRGAASTKASPVAWSITAKTAQRPSRFVHTSVASVAHSVSGVVTVMVP